MHLNTELFLWLIKLSILTMVLFVPLGYAKASRPGQGRIQKWNCPWHRERPLFWNFIAWKTFIVFTFAPYILTKLTDFLQTKRDMCLWGLVWAAKPSWDLSTGLAFWYHSEVLISSFYKLVCIQILFHTNISILRHFWLFFVWMKERKVGILSLEILSHI